MKLKKIKLKRKYKTISLIIIIFTGLYIYGHHIEPTKLVINEYKVESKKLPNHFHGIKLVHISDIHYGRTIKLRELKKIVSKVNLIEPDIVVFTGDLIDRKAKPTTKLINEVTSELKKIEVTINKYAVSGNHDKLFSSYQEILTNSNFNLLDNSYDLIYYKDYKPILISGLNTNDINVEKAMEYLSLEDKEEINYKIAIMHMPDYIEDLKKYKIDLALAGHSHNGQLRVPFIGALWTPTNSKKYYKPYYKVNSTNFYISSGLGTSMVELRTFNKPSINFYRLTKSK